NPGSPNFAGQLTFAQLMTAVDSAGENRSFLATEEYFKIVQDQQKRNLIVPLVGDFAGDKAIRSIGQYLKQHEVKVTEFYTSNVERYLFGMSTPIDDWRRFYANVATLPIEETSAFIRTGASVQQSMLGSIADLLRAHSEGKLRKYDDVMAVSR